MSPQSSLKKNLHRVIFETDTYAGKIFDIALIFFIVASVTAVILDSVDSIHRHIGTILFWAEIIFTCVFTVEYLLRLWCSQRPLKYALSFFGIIDLLAIVPTYTAFFISGSQAFLVIRMLRILRIFRILKLVRFLGEARQLTQALRKSMRKIIVFLVAVVTIVIIIGAIMHLVEDSEHTFTSIPHGIYWAIVTLTTVGYGDIVPKTPLGQALAALIMIVGYGIIAVPTGIVTAELTQSLNTNVRSCRKCRRSGHEHDANFCRYCGEGLFR